MSTCQLHPSVLKLLNDQCRKSLKESKTKVSLQLWIRSQKISTKQHENYHGTFKAIGNYKQRAVWRSDTPITVTHFVSRHEQHHKHDIANSVKSRNFGLLWGLHRFKKLHFFYKLMFMENWKWAQLRNITWFRYRLRFAFRQKATDRLLTCKQRNVISDVLVGWKTCTCLSKWTTNSRLLSDKT